MALFRKFRQDCWYLKKSFPHFDMPLPFEEAKSRVTDPHYVAARSFWPFIGFVEKARRFKKQKNITIVKDKERPLRYCSHHDGYIHAYYAHKLAESYEKTIEARGLKEVVIGYRKNLGTNIDMAKAAFDEIRKRGNCAVIALDIEGFFESIDHAILKLHLQETLGVERLSTDWFKIFRSMTRYSWVEIEDLAERLGFDIEAPPRPLCSANEFRTKVRGQSSIVNTNNKSFGIPQGSPISAAFSNVYMLNFDETCSRFAKETRAFYRRYSDDIIWVCDVDQIETTIAFINDEIEKLGPSMKINADKTEISEFKRVEGGALLCTKPVTYLGLTFDGTKTYLRHRTISRYYRRMSYASRHAASAAIRAGSNKVFMRKLYRELSHLGRQNFYSYARLARDTLGDTAPIRQLRRHFRILKRKVVTRGK